MNQLLAAAIATAAIMVGTFYASHIPLFKAVPHSGPPQRSRRLEPKPLLERTPDDIVRLAWNAVAQNDRDLARDVLVYCETGKILGEAAKRRLGEQLLSDISRLACKKVDAL